jgi:hypothetical protein
LNATTTAPISHCLDNTRTLFDIKTIAPGDTYKAEAARRPGTGTYAVNQRAKKVHSEYIKKAKNIDKRSGAIEGEVGRVERELKTYGKNGQVQGLVFGPFGECSDEVEELLKFIAVHQSRKYIDGSNMDPVKAVGIALNQLRMRVGLMVHRGWARVLIGRANSIVAKY